MAMRKSKPREKIRVPHFRLYMCSPVCISKKSVCYTKSVYTNTTRATNRYADILLSFYSFINVREDHRGGNDRGSQSVIY